MTVVVSSPSSLRRRRDGSRDTRSPSTAARSYDRSPYRGARSMPGTKESRNKELVLKAFDALFNRRNYAEAERYWSPRYVQHSAHIKPGREGLFDLVKSLPPTLRYQP